MNRIVLIVLSSIVTGCVTERPVALPNGKQGYAIRCPGAARDISDCMNEAARICAGPYQIVTANGEQVGGAVVGTGPGSGVFVAGIHRTLIVECGQAH
jgi:hypothetical protein